MASAARITKPKFTLMPHQQEAHDAVLKEFKHSDRCHIVMACGTGKTLTALAITETCRPKVVAILVPSLALINQFMKEWLANINIHDYEMLAICSDDSVTKNIETTSLLAEEINFPVCSSRPEINQIVRSNKKSVQIIFCTYQSSALMQGIKIDLAIFDEAHKTAGYGKDVFSYALHNENIKIKKRLFMTATPRRASALIKDRTSGELLALYSMDDESIYGKRAYTLGFRVAINLGLICDYKVIIAVANTDANANTCVLSNAKALREAIKKSNAKKIITYHRSVDEAKDFSKINIIPGHKRLHVSGRMPITDRVISMQTFRTSEKSIICNSKCLTEGVDVPSIDMVAFLSPKTSKIDIVQAIGRSLRNSPGKKVGYVFLPIFLDSTISDEPSAIAASDFSHIWEVLNALSEQDADLNDVIKEISKASGESGGSDTLGLDKFLNISSSNSAKFMNSIKAKILEKLTDTWYVQYGKLLAFKKKFGHAKIPARWPEDETFGNWVCSQRAMYAKNVLPQERIKLLNAVGIVWCPKDEYWQEGFVALQEYHKKTGSWTIPDSLRHTPEFKSLYHWVHSQRHAHYSGVIETYKKEALDQIGFSWDPVEEAWQETYQSVLAFYKKHGHCKIPYSKKDPELITLNKWLNGQKRANVKGYMPDHRKKLLEAVEFKFLDLQEIIPAFEAGYPRLLEYIKQHGYKLTRQGGIDVTKDAYLRHWINLMRSKYRLGALSAKEIKSLEKINIVWEPQECLWHTTFEEYKQRISNKENLRGLTSWISTQRKKFKAGTLEADKIKLLESINFYFIDDNIWPKTAKKIELYESLVKKGLDPTKDKSLKNWIYNIRSWNSRGELDNNVFQKLNKLGFNWNKNLSSIIGNIENHPRYKELLQYKKKHKNLIMPSKSGLYKWMGKVRFIYKEGKLTAADIKALNKIGFDWGKP